MTGGYLSDGTRGQDVVGEPKVGSQLTRDSFLLGDLNERGAQRVLVENEEYSMWLALIGRSHSTRSNASTTETILHQMVLFT